MLNLSRPHLSSGSGVPAAEIFDPTSLSRLLRRDTNALRYVLNHFIRAAEAQPSGAVGRDRQHQRQQRRVDHQQPREIAKAHGVSVAQVALAWLLAKPHVMSVIIGAKTLVQLDDNLAAAETPLPADLKAKLDELTVGWRAVDAER